ncbi:MAG TPA: hypothetical protein VK960_05310 [Acidimicrobiia bacterium]|nr:hypothetical protein [Acidimicrobiia bacterium]
MMSAVTDPKGEVWEVVIRGLPGASYRGWRFWPRRSGRPGPTQLDDLESGDDPIVDLFWVPVVTVVLIVIPGIVLPFLWFVVEVLLSLVLAGIVIAWRWVRRRGWEITARGGSGLRVYQADTWMGARSARRELIESIRLTGSPTTMTGRLKPKDVPP